MSSFFKLCERFPPPLVRLLARHKNGRAMTTKEIATAASWSLMWTEGVASEPEWSGVSVGDLQRFTEACNLDFTSRADLNRAETYLRKNGGKPPFKYLTSAPDWKTYYLPFIQSWHKRSPNLAPLPLPIQRLLKGLSQ